MNSNNWQSFNFQGLTPDLIVDALLAVDIRPESGLTPLNSYENRVYQFVDEDRQRKVVKFYRPQRWSLAQIEEEHQFAAELQHQQIAIAAPLNLQGKTLFCYQGYLFALYQSLGGRPYEADNLHQLEQVGRTIGRMHQAGRKRLFSTRPTIGVAEYLQQPQAIFAQSTLIPASCRQKFLRVSNELIDAVTPLWQELSAQAPLLRLHGDCYGGNILWRDEPLLVDLDDARNGVAIQDLWMLLHGDRTQQQQQLAILTDAYEEFCPFNLTEITLIEPLRAMRLVYYLAWLLRRWTDPAFPRNFPWLMEEDGWQRQIAIFTAQRNALREPPLRLTPMY